jgi:hypothetical protein
VPLSEDERQRIIEEETLRGQVKEGMKREEAMGCCGCLVAGIVLYFVIKVALVFMM